MGAPSHSASREREDAVVRWLEMARRDATEIYLVGDVFDFWFEYTHTIPKGFARLQGKLAELTDSGIPVHFFSGNHDMWGLDYFRDELGMILHREPIEVLYAERKFFIGHGDGLGHGDRFYKFLKFFFRSAFCQWLFARLHPNLGFAIAGRWSRGSRIANDRKERFLGEDGEWLVGYCKEVLKDHHVDFFIFGHRHLTLDIALPQASRYVNLGEWIHTRSYAVFDGNTLSLKYWESTQKI